MSKSLQDQLLGAGLVDGKKAKQISKEARKAKKQQGKKKEATLSEAQLAAHEAQQEKQKRDQALNQQRQQDAEKKALAAQIAQMIAHYKFTGKGGDVEYNFTDQGKIKKLFVTQAAYDEIVRGRLCIVRSGAGYELIPKPVAEKIRERDANVVVVSNEKPLAKQQSGKQSEQKAESDNTALSDEEYYAQFEIPDDLTW